MNTDKKTNAITLYKILNVQINNYGNNDKDHDNVFWYGGEVASIKSPKGEYKIVARGQVRCDLVAKKDFVDENGNKIKEGEIIASVVDKNEDGLFKKEMESYIKNDYELGEILAYNHDLYELEIHNNNWFDLEFYNKDNELEYDDCILDADSLSEAIQEVSDLIWKQNKDEKYLAIYCRVGNRKSSETLKSQEQMCLDFIQKKLDCNSELIKVYKDTCSGNTNTKHRLGVLLKDMKNNRIEQVITPSLSRLTKNIENMNDFKEAMKLSGAEIFLIKENKYLNNDIFNEIALNNHIMSIMPSGEIIEEMEEIEYE